MDPTLAQKMFVAITNHAHSALAAMEKNGFIGTLITQYINGLHQVAGSKNGIELHGSLSRLKCTNCRKDFEKPAFIEVPLQEFHLPRCPEYCAVLKGEQLPRGTWRSTEKAACECDLMIVIG